MPQHRIIYLDILRFLATLAVIMLHVSCSAMGIFTDQTSQYVGLAYDDICRWCVPVFVMISGSLFLNEEKQLSISSLYKKNVLRLFVALVSWVVIYFWVFEPILHIIKLVPYKTSCFIDVLRGPFDSVAFHLWYLPMIIGLYIILPIMRVIVNDIKISNYFLIIWFALVCIYSISTDNINYLHFVSVADIIGFSGYMILGYKLSKINIPINKMVLIVLLFLIFIVTFIAANNVSNAETIFQYFNPLVIVMSITVYCLIKNNNEKLEKKKWLCKLVVFVRNDLFGIYLIHVFYIRLLFRPHFYVHIPVIFSIPLFTIAVFVASMITIKVLRRIPIVKYICS